MEKYFNVLLEFDHNVLHSVIEQTIHLKGKGYVCIVDANVLAVAQKNVDYRGILNNAITNTCDGSSIAMMASYIYKRDLKELTGPEIFRQYIEKSFRHLLLGNTVDIHERVKNEMVRKGLSCNHIFSILLPFKNADEFEYKRIAKEINALNPELIWVSLGAPKQEVFMNRLLPYIDSGILFGIGAALNFYAGVINEPKVKFGRLNMTWIIRLIREPRKQFRRVLSYLLVLPKLIITERRKIKGRL